MPPATDVVAARGPAAPYRVPFSLREFRAAPEQTLAPLAETLADKDTLAQLRFGAYGVYLVTQPRHVEHILRTRADRYARKGVLWKPLTRLNGRGIAGEDGPVWKRSREIANPMFAGHAIRSRIPAMADAITAAVGDVAAADQPVDALATMTSIVHRALITVLFGDRISTPDATRLGVAINEAFVSVGARMLLPFVPHWVPMPGDRAFNRAVRTADEIMLPLIEAAQQDSTGDDVVARLVRAHGDGKINARQVRDDVVATFVGGTETTALLLTWLWVRLTRHPDVAEKLQAEVDRALLDPATGEPRPVTEDHLKELPYLRQVIEEVLRLYPAGYATPRIAVADDEIDGIRIKRRSIMFLSPYLTHRNRHIWPDPEEFRPERHTPEAARRRHPLASYPFGAGPHRCLGRHLTIVEATLITATLLSRHRVTVRDVDDVAMTAAIMLRPTPVKLAISPRE